MKWYKILDMFTSYLDGKNLPRCECLKTLFDLKHSIRWAKGSNTFHHLYVFLKLVLFLPIVSTIVDIHTYTKISKQDIGTQLLH